MERDAEDLVLRNGVPIQVHAYISPAPVLPAAITNRPFSVDASTIRVRDGKIVEVVNGPDVTSLRVDHTYYQPPGTEKDVVERSLQPLIKACVEGVNTCVLAVGSLRSNKSDLLFRKMDQYGLICATLQSLLAVLESKASTVNSAGSTSGRSRYSFSVQLSIVEFYEEMIMDLLGTHAGSSNRPRVAVVDGTTRFKQLKDVIISSPIRTIESVRQLIETARLCRCKDNGIYGNATEFSSAFVRIYVSQTFEFQDSPTQQLVSTFDFVDLPPSDRLANSTGALRLSEGPLLNKSLFAVLDCTTALTDTRSPASPRSPPFNESQLTQLLQDALGGNCLTAGLLFVAPGDLSGSKAALNLCARLQMIKCLPVVNNDIIRALHNKYFHDVHHLKRDQAFGHDTTRRGEASEKGFIAKIHELEGRLAQETLEKRLLKEDKDKIVSVMNELKVKYQQLFDNELEIRKELLACEQEKLTLSKAFVDYQMEKNAQMQDLDNEKFETETKLIQAEEMVVQIQQDHDKKASQIQDLCQKMNEIILEKRSLGEEIALLQKQCQETEQKAAHESKKNQQLSLELVVLVNQRQKSISDAETFEARYRGMMKQLQESEAILKKLCVDKDEQERKINELQLEVEMMRKDIARREIDIEKLELTNQRMKIDLERKNEGLAHDQETEQTKALMAAEAENAVLRNEKMILRDQLERLQADVTRIDKERESIHLAWLKKSQQSEEMLVANERLQHEVQSQVEEFRLKLSLIAARSNIEDAVASLVQSYQNRERELRTQIALLQQRLHRAQRKSSTLQELDSSSEEHAQLPEPVYDSNDLRERLHVAELQLVEQTATIAKVAENESRLQHLVDKLKNDNAELGNGINKPSQSDHRDLEATREVQSIILQQLEEIRKLSLVPQPSSQSNRQETPVASGPRGNEGTELHQLQLAKSDLERKFASNQSEWMQSFEQVEKRCADLLTKNVMLTEENDQLRNTLKSLIARIHARDNSR